MWRERRRPTQPCCCVSLGGASPSLLCHRPIRLQDLGVLSASPLSGSLLPRGPARSVSRPCSPPSPRWVFHSSWVLIEMANSGDRACSQLCQPPLPGAGGRKQNPFNMANEPPSIQRERSLLSGPLGPPHGGGSPGWPKAQVPGSSLLPAKKHLMSLCRPHPHSPLLCQAKGAVFC